jgi:hypothetical protein
MPRWEPHHHPFDKSLTVKGEDLEVEARRWNAPPARSRASAITKAYRQPIGTEPILNIDVFAPPRGYLFLVSTRGISATEGQVHNIIRPRPHNRSPVTGTNTEAVLFAWDNCRPPPRRRNHEAQLSRDIAW